MRKAATLRVAKGSVGGAQPRPDRAEWVRERAFYLLQGLAGGHTATSTLAKVAKDCIAAAEALYDGVPGKAPK